MSNLVSYQKFLSFFAEHNIESFYNDHRAYQKFQEFKSKFFSEFNVHSPYFFSLNFWSFFYNVPKENDVFILDCPYMFDLYCRIFRVNSEFRDKRNKILHVGDTVLCGRVVGKIISLNHNTRTITIEKPREVYYSRFRSNSILVYKKSYQLVKILLP